MNKPEELAHSKIKRVCDDWDAQVSPKVRVADVLRVDGSGISDVDFEFALKAHFDFLVTDGRMLPLFAVEFDGPAHTTRRQRRRDDIKNKLCEQFELPLLRIKAKHLEQRYRELDLLTWFIEVWFLGRAFDAAQQRGEIPGEEGFSPWLLSGPLGSTKEFPLWLGLEQQLWIKGEARNHGWQDAVSTSLVGSDRRGNIRGVACLRVDDSVGVLTETAMRAQFFDVPRTELVEDLLTFQIAEELRAVADGVAQLQSIGEIVEIMGRFRTKNHVYYAGGMHDLLEKAGAADAA